MPEDAWATLAGVALGAFGAHALKLSTGDLRTWHTASEYHIAHALAALLTALLGAVQAHQSLPLARLGHEVTVLDPSAAMLAKAEQRLSAEPEDVRRRVRLLQGDGHDAPAAVGGRTYDAVLCHGVLMYLPQPDAMVDALCRCVAPGGLLSVMALNAQTLAVRPALEQRWTDALLAFDATDEVGVLGAPTRGDTVDGLSELMRRGDVDPVAWYGVWLFTDWLELPLETTDVEAVAAVELEASLRDPYRRLSRVFHLVGRR